LVLGICIVVLDLDIGITSLPQQFEKCNPGSRIVPAYLPKDRTTASSLSLTVKKAASESHRKAK